MTVSCIYEYAGFQYTISVDGDEVKVMPIKGQHPAASKEKHIRAARECYLEEAGRR